MRLNHVDDSYYLGPITLQGALFPDEYEPIATETIDSLQHENLVNAKPMAFNDSIGFPVTKNKATLAQSHWPFRDLTSFSMMKKAINTLKLKTYHLCSLQHLF